MVAALRNAHSGYQNGVTSRREQQAGVDEKDAGDSVGYSKVVADELGPEVMPLMAPYERARPIKGSILKTVSRKPSRYAPKVAAWVTCNQAFFFERVRSQVQPTQPRSQGNNLAP